MVEEREERERESEVPMVVEVKVEIQRGKDFLGAGDKSLSVGLSSGGRCKTAHSE